MSRKNPLDIWSVVTFGGFAIVAIFLLYPLFDIFRYSFIEKTTGLASIGNYLTFFSKKYYFNAFLNSLNVAVVTTFVSILLGLPLAFFTSRYRIAGSSLLNTFAVLSLLSPPFIGSYSWVTMLGRNGFLRQALISIGISLPPIY